MNTTLSPHFICTWHIQVSQLGPHPWLQICWMGRCSMRLSSHSWSLVWFSVITGRNCTAKAVPSNSPLLGIQSFYCELLERAFLEHKILSPHFYQKQISRVSFHTCKIKSLEITTDSAPTQGAQFNSNSGSNSHFPEENTTYSTAGFSAAHISPCFHFPSLHDMLKNICDLSL